MFVGRAIANLDKTTMTASAWVQEVSECITSDLETLMAAIRFGALNEPLVLDGWCLIEDLQSLEKCEEYSIYIFITSFLNLDGYPWNTSAILL